MFKEEHSKLRNAVFCLMWAIIEKVRVKIGGHTKWIIDLWTVVFANVADIPEWRVKKFRDTYMPGVVIWENKFIPVVIYIYIYIYIYMYVCVCMCVCMCMYMCIYITIHVK